MVPISSAGGDEEGDIGEEKMWREEARPMTGVGSLVTLLTLEVVFDWEVFETDDEAVLDEADVLFEASSLLPASTTLMLS